MLAPRVVLALPIADRVRSYAYYGPGGLGLDTPGELADDGVPEPLRVLLNDGLELMLVPHGGFGWTLPDGHDVAARGTVECQLTIAFGERADVDGFCARVRAAGGEVLAEPEERPWGYVATLADPDGHLLSVLVPAPDLG